MTDSTTPAVPDVATDPTERAAQVLPTWRETVDDMVGRLVAADTAWCHHCGDEPAQPAYVKALAEQVVAFKPPLAAPAVPPVVYVVGSHYAEAEITAIYADERQAREEAAVLADGLEVTRYAVVEVAPAALRGLQ